MENLRTPPNNLPLVLILIGTILLAFPAAFGTIALFDTSSFGVGINELPGQILFCISIGGFGLLAGYIMTAIFRRHSGIFWLCSMLYNFGLSCCYFYLLVFTQNDSLTESAEVVWSSPYILIPLWTIFVIIASGYYLLSTLRPKKLYLS